MQDRKLDRRGFLAGTAAGVGLATARLMAGAAGANEKIVMGIIGSGGRGRALMQGFLKQPGVEFAAVCDVYEDYRTMALRIAGERAKGYNDHRELLDRKDIDAVVVGSPDHWHARHLIDSLEAGKDVYLEKPMSWSIKQGKQMVQAVRRSKQVVQVGMQRRSSPTMREAKRWVDSGVLGEVKFARAQWYWNMLPLVKSRPLKGKLDWERFRGPDSKLALDSPQNARFFNWRYWWDFSGGNMTDQGTHLMDVIQWFLNDGKPPISAISYGAVYRLQPGETPDTFSAVFEYPKFVATWTLCYTNSFEDGWRVILQGDKATMVFDDRGYKVYPDPGRGKPALAASHEGKGALAATEPHLENFLSCVRSRKEPNAPVEVGHHAVTAPHLANIAFHKSAKAVLSEDGTVAVRG